MRPLTEQLNQSIAEYRQLQQGYETVAAALAAGADWVVASGLAELQQLETRIRQSDAELNAEAAASTEPLPEALWQERLQLISSAAEANRRLRGHSGTLLALLAEERTQLNGGRTAMSGYRMGGDQRGSVVRSSC
jgi:hypothetical protein